MCLPFYVDFARRFQWTAGICQRLGRYESVSDQHFFANWQQSRVCSVFDSYAGNAGNRTLLSYGGDAGV